MDRTAYDKLLHPHQPGRATISASDISGPDRTLLYGYDCARDTWHVYLLNGQIHVEIFNPREEFEHRAAQIWVAEDLVPNKRVYPEDSDDAFISELRRLGVDVSLTRFDDRRYERVKDLTFTREPRPL